MNFVNSVNLMDFVNFDKFDEFCEFREFDEFCEFRKISEFGDFIEFANFVNFAKLVNLEILVNFTFKACCSVSSVYCLYLLTGALDNSLRSILHTLAEVGFKFPGNGKGDCDKSLGKSCKILAVTGFGSLLCEFTGLFKK